MDTKAKALAIFAAAVILGVVLLVNFREPARVSLPGESEPVFVSRSELPEGFGEELILAEDAVILGGYSIGHKEGLVQRTTTFYSALSLGRLQELYKNYFQLNGWTVKRENASRGIARGLYATKSNLTVSVAILDKWNRREVQITSLGERRTIESALPGPSRAVSYESVAGIFAKYFDLNQVRPYDVQTAYVESGSGAEAGREWRLSFDTGHLKENYEVVRQSIVGKGLAVSKEELYADGAFTIVASGEKSSVGITGWPTSRSNVGSITMLIFETQ